MQDLSTLAGSAPGATSRLLIHAAASEGARAWSMDGLLRRLRERARGEHAPSTLEIRDLQGHRWLTLTNAGALIDLVLPTGTYHVSTRVGDDRRHYTVALQQDATTDLYLRGDHR